MYMAIGQQLPVSDAVEFQTLDMKRARRTEQNQVLEVGILQHREAGPYPVSRPVLDDEVDGIRRLDKPIKTRM